MRFGIVFVVYFLLGVPFIYMSSGLGKVEFRGPLPKNALLKIIPVQDTYPIHAQDEREIHDEG